MNQKQILTALAVVVVVVIALVLFNKSNKVNDSTEQTNKTDTVENVDTNSTEPATNTNSTSSEMATNPPVAEPTAPDGNDVAVSEITFDGKSFSPSNITIKNGDIVVFNNKSDGDFWPASAPHPQHTNYPEFDSKKAISAGGSWQFKFTKSGSWGFHDHLTPSAFGKITVQ